MSTTTPEETVQAIFEAFNQGDVEAAVALYEPNGVLVVQPGQLAEGTAALREALAGFIAMKPVFTLGKSELVMAGDLALSMVRWSLTGTGPDGEPVQMEGTTSDILRKQADGSWLYAIDNPWGAGILG